MKRKTAPKELHLLRFLLALFLMTIISVNAFAEDLQDDADGEPSRLGFNALSDENVLAELNEMEALYVCAGLELELDCHPVSQTGLVMEQTTALQHTAHGQEFIAKIP